MRFLSYHTTMWPLLNLSNHNFMINPSIFETFVDLEGRSAIRHHVRHNIHYLLNRGLNLNRNEVIRLTGWVVGYCIIDDILYQKDIWGYIWSTCRLQSFYCPDYKSRFLLANHSLWCHILDEEMCSMTKVCLNLPSSICRNDHHITSLSFLLNIGWTSYVHSLKSQQKTVRLSNCRLFHKIRWSWSLNRDYH